MRKVTKLRVGAFTAVAAALSASSFVAAPQAAAGPNHHPGAAGLRVS